MRYNDGIPAGEVVCMSGVSSRAANAAECLIAASLPTLLLMEEES